MKNLFKKSVSVLAIVFVVTTSSQMFVFADDYGTFSGSNDYGTYIPTNDYGTYNPINDFGTYNTTGSFGTYTPTNSFGTYVPTDSYGTYAPTNSYGTYSPTDSYGTYTPTNSYGTYTQTNSYGTYTPTNSYGTYSPTDSYGTYTPTNNYGTYTTPTVANTYNNYNPVESGYYGGNSYGTNSFGIVNYGQSNYGSVNYGSTNYGTVNYGQTGSSWTGVVTNPNNQVNCPANSTYSGSGTICNCNTGFSLLNGACQATQAQTVFNTAWCQSIGWDYVTDTVHGYCACNSGRTYSGDPNTGRGGTCQSPVSSCTLEAKICPDGSSVGRVAPSCNFAACPTVTQCSSGTYLFNGSCVACPTGVSISPGPAGCPVIQPITTCPYGTYLFNGSCTACPTGVAVSPGPTGCPVNQNPTCPVGTTLINGVCQINTTVCPIGSTLINGVCQVNTTVCPTGSTLVNGVCQINGTQCPAGSTLVGGICQINSTVCPTGATLVNGVCQINGLVCPSGSTLINNICQINNTVCPTGSTLINGVCQAPITCPTGTTLQNGVCLGYGTTVCPNGSTLINNVCQINQTTCPSGSSFINGVCQAPITCPSGTSYQNGSCVNNQVMVTCPNGSVVNSLYQCPVTYGQTSYGQTSYGQTNYNQNISYNIPQVVYQTCWDGSVIPNTSICQSQYKMCANGTSIPINQTCYVAPVPVYVPPVVIKFNNVVTSVVTQITNTSARCNGIGLIAQGAQSTGWFEYGQTANLGRTTSPAIIGSSATAPFSNVLSNLQPTTTYFCRAVMQNQYGIVKGEIVKFTTNKKVTTYVQPAPTKTAVKKVVKKDEIICSDGSVVSVNNQTSAGMLNQGQKLIAVQMEKITGDLTAGGNVSYRLSYKNLSGTSLSGVIIKVVIPEEISLTDVPMGSYDEATHTMTFSGVSVNPYSENVINWSGTVKKEAPVGKTIVTTAYVLYTIPGTQVQDEVTAYTASSIIAGQDIQKSAGVNHVIGAGVGSFLPSSLVEWLALIAILFIIFILGRSIAASYRKGDEAHH